MADIFISYAREDHSIAERLAHALEAQGWSVWWDRVIPAGRSFDQVIEEALDHARCVVVLWSAAGVASQWVRTEAHEGMDRGILTPVLLERVRIPLAFRRIQGADLIGWDGSTESLGFQGLITGLFDRLGSSPATQIQLDQKQEPTDARSLARQAERRIQSDRPSSSTKRRQTIVREGGHTNPTGSSRVVRVLLVLLAAGLVSLGVWRLGSNLSSTSQDDFGPRDTIMSSPGQAEVGGVTAND